MNSLAPQKIPGLFASMAIIAVACLAVAAPPKAAPLPPIGPVTHGVTGLFDKSREAELTKAFESIEGVKITAIEFDRAQVTFVIDRTKTSVEKINNSLRPVAFGLTPASTLGRDALRRIEIPVRGLDCKACAFAAYEAVAKLDGVEQATASFKEGKVTALFDPKRVDQAAMEAALKKKGVDVVGQGPPGN